MNNSALVVKYAEIHLKGLNRPFFERKLVEKIEETLSDAKPRVVREQGRIFVYELPEEHLEEYAARLQKVFGIHSVSVAACGEKTWEEVRALGIRLMAAYRDEPKTFKVFARRADKRFPMTSEMICRELGGELLQTYPNLKVDVHHRSGRTRPSCTPARSPAPAACPWAPTAKPCSSSPVGSTALWPGT